MFIAIIIPPLILAIILFAALGVIEADLLQGCGNGPECQILSTALLPLKILPFGLVIVAVMLGIFGIMNGTVEMPDNDLPRDEPWEDEPPSMPIGHLLKRDTDGS